MRKEAEGRSRVLSEIGRSVQSGDSYQLHTTA